MKLNIRNTVLAIGLGASLTAGSLGFAREQVDPEIVGVVEDMRQDSLDAALQPEIFASLRQIPPSRIRTSDPILVIRTTADPTTYVPTLRGLVREQTPMLTSVTAAYLPRNTRPRVTNITIHPPGTVFQRPFPTGDPEIAGFEGDTPDRRAASLNPAAGPVTNTPALGRRAYQKGLLTFVWRAEDENRDDLTLGHWVLFLHQHLLHGAGVLGDHGNLHLHRLDHDQRVAGFHPLAWLRAHLPNRPGDFRLDFDARHGSRPRGIAGALVLVGFGADSITQARG